jgi:hypothetical protein
MHTKPLVVGPETSCAAAGVTTIIPAINEPTKPLMAAAVRRCTDRRWFMLLSFFRVVGWDAGGSSIRIDRNFGTNAMVGRHRGDGGRHARDYCRTDGSEKRRCDIRLATGA